MDHNNHLQNNNELDGYSNNLQQSPQMEQSALYDNVNTSCGCTDYLLVMDNDTTLESYAYSPNDHEQHEHNVASTTPPLSYAPQHHYNISSPPSVDPFNMIPDSSQTNYSEISFEIPGFKIIITCIPTTVNLNNLDIQNQQDYTSNIVVDNSQAQFQQDYNFSNIDFSG